MFWGRQEDTRDGQIWGVGYKIRENTGEMDKY